MFKKLIICLIVVLLSACKADCFDDKAMTKFEFKSSIKGIILLKLLKKMKMVI